MLVLGIFTVSIAITAYKWNTRRLRQNEEVHQSMQDINLPWRGDIIPPDYGHAEEGLTLNPLYNEDR